MEYVSTFVDTTSMEMSVNEYSSLFSNGFEPIMLKSVNSQSVVLERVHVIYYLMDVSKRENCTT
jgi:hypothetical protein